MKLEKFTVPKRVLVILCDAGGTDECSRSAKVVITLERQAREF